MMQSSRKVLLRGGQLPLGRALCSSGRLKFLGLSPDDYIRQFFTGGATVAILILVMIMIFLFREGLGFFPMSHQALELNRRSGLEFVDAGDQVVQEHAALARDLEAWQREMRAGLQRRGMDGAQIRRELALFDAGVGQFRAAIGGHQKWGEPLKALVVKARDQQRKNDDLEKGIKIFVARGDAQFAQELRAQQVAVDYAGLRRTLGESLAPYRALNRALVVVLGTVEGQLAQVPPDWRGEARGFQKRLDRFRAGLEGHVRRMGQWNPQEPVPLHRSVTAFLTGRQWLTASFWQDLYGVVPLFMGSLLVSVLALAVAVPVSVSAAIYANQVAKPGELNVIKPYIEFIQAIPSVVLGFFGIAVLGSLLQEFSQSPWLAWFPGFPMAERLTIATAGLLLGLMAIPTIFTLVEDALNNVPRHYVEASYALGATRFQTVVHIMIPAALSGIVAAVLLGLGRVIGETMVVLLCAGNRIAIPDFTRGLGVFFQPAHTMTGIIAQEMGEVPLGSIHYRALFMVGVVLFFISLALNYLSQLVISRYRIGE